MFKYAETVRPEVYQGSDTTKLTNYHRQCAFGKQIGVFLDNVQAMVDSEKRLGRSITFTEISDTLRIPIEDVKCCLWNQSGGGDHGITIFPTKN